MNYSKPLSYSGLSLWKQCPRRWAYQYVEGHREAPGPAARRGTMLHEKLEDYFRGSPYPLGDSTLAPWAKYMEALLDQALEPECKLAVLDDWTPTDFDDPKALARGAADGRQFETFDDTLYIYDWKSGREYDTHEAQGKMYMAMDWAVWERCIVRFVYLDNPLVVRDWTWFPADRDETREQLAEQIHIVRHATEYPETPGDHCNWCPLSWRKGGECKRAR